jgi:hypothetical protein
MHKDYAFIDQFLRPVDLYPPDQRQETHSILHLEMRHTEFRMEFNTMDDRPTQVIVATRQWAWPSTTIHVAVGYLAHTGDLHQKQERDIPYETPDQAITAFLQLFDDCLAFALDDQVPRGENLMLDVFRSGRNRRVP